jgi:hypothetical protein
MWPFRKRRPTSYESYQQRREVELAILRAKSDERDRVFTKVFGTGVEQVESCWDWYDRGGVVLKVYYRSGYVGDVFAGDPRLREIAGFL